MMPKPMPSPCTRAAISRSGPDNSSTPLGWLCTSISPRCANPGSASTQLTSPRATGRAPTITPPGPTWQAKQTSLPPASAMVVRIAFAGPLPIRFSSRVAAELTLRSCLERLLLRGRKEHVVQDEPVPGRIRVQGEVGRQGSDVVLGILGVVPAEVGPRTLAVVAVQVLHPGRAVLGRQDHVAGFQHGLVEGRRYAVEVGNHLPVVLHEHRSNRIELC